MDSQTHQHLQSIHSDFPHGNLETDSWTTSMYQYMQQMRDSNHKPTWVYHQMKRHYLLCPRGLKIIRNHLNFKPGWERHKFKELQQEYSEKFQLAWNHKQQQWEFFGELPKPKQQQPVVKTESQSPWSEERYQEYVKCQFTEEGLDKWKQHFNKIYQGESAKIPG